MTHTLAESRQAPAVGGARLAWPLAAAGIALAAYPMLRPAMPEEGMAGAMGFASQAWLISHCLAMIGFVLLAFGLRALAGAPPPDWAGQPVRRAETRAWLAVALLLPYYGAEAYGLNVAGRFAVQSGSLQAVDAVLGFRLAPVEAVTFAAGLLMLALVGARLVIGWWRAGGTARLGAVLAGGALLTYLPQFFTPMPVRIAHGVALGAGLVLIAVTLARRPR